MPMEEDWGQKDNEELLAAARHLSGHSQDAQAAILAELHRRDLPVPTQEAFSVLYHKSVAGAVLLALFFGPLGMLYVRTFRLALLFSIAFWILGGAGIALSGETEIVPGVVTCLWFLGALVGFPVWAGLRAGRINRALDQGVDDPQKKTRGNKTVLIAVICLAGLAIVIPTIAVVVGISQFGESGVEANRNALLLDCQNIVSSAQIWYRKPASMGGGARSFSGLTLEKMGISPANENTDGTGFRLTVLNPQKIRVDVRGREPGVAVRMTYDADTGDITADFPP